jgi:hypothetical protein
MLETYWRNEGAGPGRDRALTASASQQLQEKGVLGRISIDSKPREAGSAVPDEGKYLLPARLKELASPRKGEGYYQPLQKMGNTLIGRSLAHDEIMALVSASAALQKERGKNPDLLTTRDVILPQNGKELTKFLDNIGTGQRSKLDGKRLQEFKQKIREALLHPHDGETDKPPPALPDDKRGKPPPALPDDKRGKPPTALPDDKRGKPPLALPDDKRPPGGRPDSDGRGLPPEERPEGQPAERQSPSQPGDILKATFVSVHNRGRLDQMMSGVMYVNGTPYAFNTGGQGRGNLPPGDYMVTARNWNRATSGAINNIGGVGFTFAMTDKWDSRVGDVRDGLQIHPDGGRPGTHGCVGIAGDSNVQRRFRQDMAAELARHGGKVVMRFA